MQAWLRADSGTRASSARPAAGPRTNSPFDSASQLRPSGPSTLTLRADLGLRTLPEFRYEGDTVQRRG